MVIMAMVSTMTMDHLRHMKNESILDGSCIERQGAGLGPCLWDELFHTIEPSQWSATDDFTISLLACLIRPRLEMFGIVM